MGVSKGGIDAWGTRLFRGFSVVFRTFRALARNVPNGRRMNSSPALETFTVHRAFLFSIAYRMLGSQSDAEDMVQETWLRWQSLDTTRIRCPKAWLGSVMRRLCIDQLRSARHHVEEHYGIAVPETSLEAGNSEPEPAISAEQESSLAMAFTRMLEALKPLDRVVFLLREVLGYDYSCTARIVGKAEANCRQIVHRARTQLLAHSISTSQPTERARHLVEEFASATATGEIQDLLALMREDSFTSLGSTYSRKATRQTNGGSHIVAVSFAIPTESEPVAA